MSFKAIDIVLIPDDQVIDRLTKFNKSLIYKGDDQVVFGENVIPHISLRMLIVNDEDINFLNSAFSELHEVELEIDRYFPIDRIIKKSWFAGFKEDNLIRRFHYNMMKMKFPNKPKNSDSECFMGDEISERTISYVKDFKDYSLDFFHPHITMGRGEKNFKSELPITGMYRPAIFHMGNHCTCVEEIFIQE